MGMLTINIPDQDEQPVTGGKVHYDGIPFLSPGPMKPRLP